MSGARRLSYSARIASVRGPALLWFALATLAAQQEGPPHKFSAPASEAPLYKFGTTVVASSGFRGEIYFIEPGTERLPDFSRLKPVGTIYTPCLNVPAQSFDQGFPGVTNRFEWFAIDYHARFWVSRPGRYYFALVSDDGSVLYIDDKKIIDNDGGHPVLQKEGNLKLKEGVHRIRVSYYQGPRYQVALLLGVSPPKERHFRLFHTDEFMPPPDAPGWDAAEDGSGPVPQRKR